LGSPPCYFDVILDNRLRRLGTTDQMEDMEKSSTESIQDYGKYLENTADTFQYTDFVMEPASVQPVTIPEKRALDFLFEWFSWRNFRFNTDFAQLAPPTTREDRIHARQSANLSDWILDWGNDVFFGWQSLGQVVGPPPPTEETRRQRDIVEQTALQQILEVVEDPAASTVRQGGIWSALDGIPERAQSPLARYLSQEDTRSVVSQDNHWRRTIFG
jgi:hypothetical protein